MRFASLGSGSKGNATLVDSGETIILVDCGFTLRTLSSRLKVLGVGEESVSAIIVTHEHSDHWKGVKAFSERYHTPVYLSAGCFRAVELTEGADRFNIIDCHKPFAVGDLTILPVPVPHDAKEPIQYVIRSVDCKLGVLTDLGHYTPHVVSTFSHCDGLILECNYDEKMLLSGPYPKFLKQRVGGDYGHLSNRQAGQLLSKMELANLQILVLGHISESNNYHEAVMGEIQQFTPVEVQLALAKQNRASSWFHLKASKGYTL